ncbi:MAG: energy transducer TonB [Verrucomicrobiota bacterium]|nr:energy transducer TonB [Verrucomicrobiota bacterium]
MGGPLLYKPAPKWQVALAVVGALAIDAIAVGIAALKPEPPPIADVAQLEQIAEVTFEPAPPEPPEPTPPPEEPDPVEPPPIPEEQPEFVEEQPTPPPKPRTEKPKSVQPIARPRPQGPTGTTSMSNAKAVAVSAPRPEYPYEARRSKLTGSGVCVMTVDTSSGSVTSAEMAVSTGSAILDNAAKSAFRRWRFRPGTVSKVRTPITFTMTGAQF